MKRTARRDSKQRLILPSGGILLVLALLFVATSSAFADEPSTGVCERTVQVRDLLTQTLNQRCENITTEHLASMSESMFLSYSGISSLKPGDFDGLSNLEYLHLMGNNLESLPAGIFDNNPNLRFVFLDNNEISSLPRELFKNNTRLEQVYFSGNRLTTFPEGIFKNNPKLWLAGFAANKLITLPDKLFPRPYDADRRIRLLLQENKLQALPGDLFQVEGINVHLLYLHDNPGADWIFAMEAEVVSQTVDENGLAAAQVRYKVARGAPVIMASRLTVSGGTASASTVTITSGDVYSDEITINQNAPGEPVTVTLDSDLQLSLVLIENRLCVYEEDDYTGVKFLAGPALTLFGEDSHSLAESDASSSPPPLPNSLATGVPTISGTPKVGETLTADTSGIADEDGLNSAAFRYQWMRVDGAIETNIGTGSSSYTLVAGDSGKTIKVRVAFTDAADNEETLTSAATEVVQQGSNAWSATMTVETRDGFTGYSFWGNPHLGSLSATEVEWDGKTHYVRYIFLKDGELRLGLNEEMFSTGFVLSVGDEEFGSADAMVDKGGASYRFRWDDPGLGWSDGNEVSVNLVQSDQNTSALGTPTISGTAQVDETLTADTTGVEDADGLTNVSYSYQWMANNGTTDTNIQDATDSTYTPSPSDVGKTIKVKVTFTDDAGNAETLTSEPTETVTATAPTVPLSLTVTAGSQDQELEASWQAPSSNGGSDVTGYKVQWKEAADSWDTAADVSEAAETGTTHTITGLTGGVEYAVRVIATNDAGDGPASTEAKGTPAVSEQVDEPENSAPTGLPTISGTPQVDQTLTADTSPIDDEDGLTNVSYSYQWIAGGSDIAGATGSTYTLTSSEQGQTIRVRVTFTDDADNEETLTSIATAEVAAAPVPLTVRVTVSAPATHDGSSEFTFEIEFSEEVKLSYVTLKNHAFNVTGGSVEKGAKNGQAQQHSLAHHGKAARQRGRDHRTPGNHGLRRRRRHLHQGRQRQETVQLAELHRIGAGGLGQVRGQCLAFQATTEQAYMDKSVRQAFPQETGSPRVWDGRETGRLPPDWRESPAVLREGFVRCLDSAYSTREKPTTSPPTSRSG